MLSCLVSPTEMPLVRRSVWLLLYCQSEAWQRHSPRSAGQGSPARLPGRQRATVRGPLVDGHSPSPNVSFLAI